MATTLTQKPKSTTVTLTQRTKNGRVTAIDYLLLQDGAYMLQEDTDKILIQNTTSGGWAVKPKS